MSERLVLGVDGGGSRTRAWIARDEAGAVPIGRGVAGCSNPTVRGLDQALDSIERAVERARREAGDPELDAACLCLAGCGMDAVRDLLAARLVHLARRVSVKDDAAAVLALAGPGEALALIAGTGSLCVARDARGALHRAGGLGQMLGDEGSAYAVANEGARAALRAVDGRGEPTSLVEAFGAALGGVPRDAQAMASAFRERIEHPAQLAGFARLVTTAARDGDQVASHILDGAARELARLARAAADRAGIGDRPALCVSGSFAVALYDALPAFADELGRVRPHAVVRTIEEPVRGALALALHVEPSRRRL